MAETKKENKNPTKFRKFNHPHEISIWIDSYDDIFSDFDSRPFSKRNISDDFLYEVKKVSVESEFEVNELKLLIHEKSRKPEIEQIIIKQLHMFLVRNQHKFLKNKKREKKKGVLFLLIGFLMMFGASYVSLMQSQHILMHILFVVLEPSGWFLVWIGLENILIISRKEKPDRDFYSKMAKCRITFMNLQNNQEQNER